MSTTSIPTTHTTHAEGPAVASTATTERRLRTVLRVDAATSAASGLLLAVAPNAVDDVLGTGHPSWVRFVGIGFLAFALDVALLSRVRPEALRRWTPAVVVANEAYVLATVAGIALGWFDTTGAVLAGLAAAMVGTFAALQWRFRQALR